MRRHEKRNAEKELLEQKKQADEQWERVKENVEYIPSAISVSNSVEWKLLREEWKRRDAEILRKYPDIDLNDPINIEAEERRQKLIEQLESATGKKLEQILGHKPLNTWT